MKTKILLLTLPLMALTACSDMSNMEDPQQGGSVQYVLMVPDVKPLQLTAEQKTFAADNNQFALRFLQAADEADQGGQGFVYSPLSITYVLAMVNSAAEGQTRQELEQTLGFHKGGIEAVNHYCQKLIEGLPLADESLQLSLANGIFLNKQFTLKPQFEQDMQQYFHARAQALDFADPATLGLINDWCRRQTQGMIPTILDKLNPDAVSYLLNAIHLKAEWTSKFDEKATREETFTAEDGSSRKLPLMHQHVFVNYTRNDVFSSIDIPFGNGTWSMAVMLPQEGKSTRDVVRWLSENGWDDASPRSFAPHAVDLKLPRFAVRSDTDQMGGGQSLPSLLQDMGIREAFHPSLANIPNMCQEGGVFVSNMRQKAAIDVNEEGAEASAVTMGEVLITSAGPETDAQYQKVDFHANRPFVYLIHEHSSGMLLFVGKFTGK